MHISKERISVKVEAPGAVARQQTGFGDASGYGAIGGEYFSMAAGTDLAPLLEGLEGGSCHVPHWGYMIGGRVTPRPTAPSAFAGFRSSLSKAFSGRWEPERTERTKRETGGHLLVDPGGGRPDERDRPRRQRRAALERGRSAPGDHAPGRLRRGIAARWTVLPRAPRGHSDLAFLVGGLVAWAASGHVDVDFLVPFADENFLYIGAADLVPEVNKHGDLATNALHLAAFVGGIVLLRSVRVAVVSTA